MNSAICVVTLRPDELWCEFLNDFINYDVFIVVDDEKFDTTQLQNKYKKINFVQLTEKECGDFKRANLLFLRRFVTGWDKAIYWFCKQQYEKVWFIEHDVFFYSEETLIQIDKKFPEEDLLSKRYVTNQNGNLDIWHWRKFNIEFDPPWYRTMVCTVRASNNLLKCIENYVYENQTLFFIEALFPTIAIKNELDYKTPEEFNEIYFRKEFDKENIKHNQLYHPLKNPEQHFSLRTKLKAKLLM
jgi:hypothetical protein